MIVSPSAPGQLSGGGAHGAAAQRRLALDVLSPEMLHAALLSPAFERGDRLRNRRQAARMVTMTVTWADRSQVRRSRQLPAGPNAHTEGFRDTVHGFYRALGFQRAKVVASRCAVSSWSTWPRLPSSCPSTRAASGGCGRSGRSTYSTPGSVPARWRRRLASGRSADLLGAGGGGPAGTRPEWSVGTWTIDQRLLQAGAPRG
ncbi:DinB/UmuC family translesion DNA polymerase [Streptomyces virginiae]